MANGTTKILEEALSELSQLQSNVSTLSTIFTGHPPDPIRFVQLDGEIRQLQATSEALCVTLDKALRLAVPKIIEDPRSKNQALESLKVYKRNAEQTIKEQTEQIAQLKAELATIKEQAAGQIESISWIGSIMAALLWKACKQQESVKALIGTDSLREFIGMSNCVLSSFVARHQQSGDSVQLSSESEDYKFLASLCGAMTNLAAYPEGRAHLVSEADGLLFTNSLLHAVQLLRMPAGRLLKRISLTFVYNICLEPAGVQFVMKDDNRLRNIVACLNLVNSEDVLMLAVSLLVRLIKAATPCDQKNAICRQVPRGIVKYMTDFNYPLLKETATHLLELVEFDWRNAVENETI
ncbi:uncharacterized protein LOC129722544 isoform X2 [Wyeomyia smithii]|uniref:uncharacterized protein LOC129722544 isoform X2 n=1 Tax=Wyeomyia smithii TaxID=174621 RepID=UPI002467EBE4|nr:uncharacterized protein LOC129722544 isoform X2 [Wyeomyia smithii]